MTQDTEKMINTIIEAADVIKKLQTNIAELEAQNKSLIERLISATKEIDRLRIETDKNYKGYKFRP